MKLTGGNKVISAISAQGLPAHLDSQAEDLDRGHLVFPLCSCYLVMYVDMTLWSQRDRNSSVDQISDASSTSRRSRCVIWQ